MYEDEVYQLPTQAGSSHHHFRDVLQAFVQDFSLRQAAGETKIREIERQLSDATGEIHLLRHLLEEYQTKLNDDNVLITRLHHEIEALQGRVSNLDRKNIQTEALSSRLEIRLDHLKECLTQTCNDTQKGVSKLLGNFAKVNFSGDFAKKEDFVSTKEAKEQEISVRRKNVSAFAQANYSDGSGFGNNTTATTKSTGDFDLNEKPDRTHSTYSRQSSATHVYQSPAEHEYVIPTNDVSMTNECPSTDMPLTNDMNPTTDECLPFTVAKYSVNDKTSRQPVGDSKTANLSNNTSTKHTSSFQDSSNSTAKVPPKTTQDNIQAPASSNSTSNSAQLPPVILVSPCEDTTSTGSRRHGLPKGKKGPKGNRGQGPVKNNKHPRTTSLSEEHGRSNRRPRTTSLTEEQSNIQKQRRTASFCEDQLHCNRKDHPTSDHREESNTSKKQHTHSFTGEQSKANKQHTSVNEEHGNANRKNRTGVNEQGKSKNTKEQINAQGSEKQVTLKSKEQPVSSRENNEQATSNSKNSKELTNNQGNKEQSNAQARKEQITSKGNQEQLNNRSSEHITAQASEQQTTSHGNAQASEQQTTSHDNAQASEQQTTSHGNAQASEQTTSFDNAQASEQQTTSHDNAQASEQQTTTHGNAQASEQQTTSHGNAQASEQTTSHDNAQASEQQTTSHDNAQASEQQTTSHGNAQASEQQTSHGNAQASEQQISHGNAQASEEQTTSHGNVQASEEQTTSHGNNKQATKKGNETQVNKKSNGKHVNKGNGKHVNKGNEELVHKGNEKHLKGNEKHVNKGNEELVNKGNEELVNKGNEKHVNKGNEKHVNKGNEKHVKGNEKHVKKGNEKHVKKGNERQSYETGNANDVSLKGNAEKAVIPDKVDSVFPKNSEHHVSFHNSEEHCVAQGSEKPVIPNGKEEQVIPSQVSEQPQAMNHEELEACQSTEEQVSIHSTEKQVTFCISEEQTQNSEQTSKNTENQTFQSSKEKDGTLVKGVSFQNSEELTRNANEERRTPQGNEEQTNHSNSEEQITSQNSKQHTPTSLETKDGCVTVNQSESSLVNVNSYEHPPDGATPRRAPQVNHQDSSDVAATEHSPKVGTVKQRNKETQAKWEESKKEETKTQESVKQSLARDESVFLPGLRRRSFRMDGEEDHQEQEVGMCAHCGFLAKLRCANCRQAFYCKRECQREHWKKGHKDQCQPFQIMESAELGRFVVASRDLKAGDVILKEEPLVVGPKQITEPLCLGCYSKVDGSYRCQKCQWPMCGPECERCPDHQPECVVGQEIGSPIEITNFQEPNHFYEVVFPLRCLALKKKSPKKYEQLLALESHYEDRKGTHVHRENQKRIVNFLRNYFFIQEFPIEDIDSSERSIHNITGIIDVNALELRLKESEVLGLYPTFAMLEHSCTPNTKHSFNKERQVVLKAAVDIKRGEHISTMYTHILWGTAARRDHLKHSKYFMCTCFRCSDPTELGTHFSALRCKQCTNGFMLSAAPLDELASWICTSCNATMTSDVVTETNLKLGEEVEGALAMPNREGLEELVQRHAKNTVHPNHFHLFAARHTLLQMYGRDPNSADEASMKKKEKMCQDFLKVCTALDPGMSRLAPYAGVALYEYHLAVLARARQDPEAKQVDSAALKKDVETAKALLQQCIRVLQDEPADQPEGQLCHVAQQNLAELRQWEATLS